MTRGYSLLLATAIMLLVMVYAYDPLYVLAYIAALATMLYSTYVLLQWKHQPHEFRKETH